MASQRPERATLFHCYDCNLLANQCEEQPGYQEFAEEPWTALWCMNCGEPVTSHEYVLDSSA